MTNKEKSINKKNSSLLKQWLEHAEELLDFINEFSGKAISAPNTPHDIESAKVVAFKFAQAVRTLRGILTLVKNGDATNSIILGRALFENLVDAAFLAKNSTEVWRYFEESAELESKIILSHEKYGPPKRDSLYKKSNRPSPESIKEHFGKLADEHSNYKSWRRLNIKTRAEKTGNNEIIALYEMMYPISSGYVHGSSTIVMDYLRDIKKNHTGFHVDYESRESELEISLAWASIIFLNFLYFLDNLFQMGLKERLIKLERFQNKMFSKAYKQLMKSYF